MISQMTPQTFSDTTARGGMEVEVTSSLLLSVHTELTLFYVLPYMTFNNYMSPGPLVCVRWNSLKEIKPLTQPTLKKDNLLTHITEKVWALADIRLRSLGLIAVLMFHFS